MGKRLGEKLRETRNPLYINDSGRWSGVEDLLQVLVVAISCRFKSCYPHHSTSAVLIQFVSERHFFFCSVRINGHEMCYCCIVRYKEDLYYEK